VPTRLEPEEPTGASRIGRMSTPQFGLIVLFVSMTVLFGASLVAYLVTRAQNPVWRTPEMPRLPLGLLASTVILVALSAFMHRAERAARENRNEGLLRELKLAFVAGAAFLVCQSANWKTMIPALYGADPHARYAFTFYFLTALHAAHVVGGFIPLGIVLARAHRRHYSSSRYEGVRLCKQYWDYLGAVWLVLLAALYLAT
jgi:heme/copper-type cytochrome/quinol oxidase subunit 3